MNIYYFTFAQGKFKKLLNFNRIFTKNLGGFDYYNEFDESHIDNKFIGDNRELFNYQRGFGVWVWKPYLVLNQLEEANIGDIVVYGDSSVLVFRDIKKYLSDELQNKEIIFYETPFIEKYFTSFDLQNHIEVNELAWNTPQLHATFFAIKKSNFTMHFINEWLELCTNKTCLLPNDNFSTHRHDQSIFSLLVKKYDLKKTKDITLHGAVPELYLSIPRTKNGYTNVAYTDIDKSKLSNVSVMFIKRLPVVKSLFTIIFKSLIVLVKRKINL